MVDTSASDMLVDNKVFIEFKEAFSEQFVAQEMENIPLYAVEAFFSKENLAIGV